MRRKTAPTTCTCKVSGRRGEPVHGAFCSILSQFLLAVAVPRVCVCVRVCESSLYIYLTLPGKRKGYSRAPLRGLWRGVGEPVFRPNQKGIGTHY